MATEWMSRCTTAHDGSGKKAEVAELRCERGGGGRGGSDDRITASYNQS